MMPIRLDFVRQVAKTCDAYDAPKRLMQRAVECCEKYQDDPATCARLIAERERVLNEQYYRLEKAAAADKDLSGFPVADAFAFTAALGAMGALRSHVEAAAAERRAA